MTALRETPSELTVPASPERPNGAKRLGRKADSIGHPAVASWPRMKTTKPTMSLTPRQRQVLSLMAEGKTTREIAYELGLSPFTVKNYIERIYERLGALDRVQAVSMAVRQGLID
jgi:DNA-binding NarL/FixJ family response regulator